MIQVEFLKQRVAQFRTSAESLRNNAKLGNVLYSNGRADAFSRAADLIQVLITRHEPLQARVARWVRETFEEDLLRNRRERCLRFIEEALELVQALDLPKEDVLKLVEYVYSRDRGEPRQELGGVMVTALALAECASLDAFDELRRELDRIFAAQDSVRRKHQQKIQEGVAE